MRDREPRLNRRDFAIATGTGLIAASVSGAAGAQESTPAPVVEHYDVTGVVHRFTVGDFECLAVSDGSSINNDPNDIWNYYGLIFGASDPEAVQAALEAGGYDAANLIRQDTRLLVDTGDQLVLIDTGIGPAFGGALLANLEGEGIATGDIDVVITTHGHPDHIGGNTVETGEPTFANARYVIAREEWDFWTDESAVKTAVPNAAIQEVILGFIAAGMLPLVDRYELIGADEEIVPGITSIASPGHTPGHMSLLVQSNGESLWVAGDFASHPVTLQHPSLAGYADIDPGLMEATRGEMFTRMAEGGLALFGHFDPFPGLGTVSADGDAWTWQPLPARE